MLAILQMKWSVILGSSSEFASMHILIPDSNLDQEAQWGYEIQTSAGFEELWFSDFCAKSLWINV